jgi:formylglycine-generating enzyme required for sulfatase activity
MDDIIDDTPRLLRSGSFRGQSADIRSAYHEGFTPTLHHYIVGFRPARTYN